MKFSAVIVAAAAGLVAAADPNFPGIDDCAVGCLSSAIPKVGCQLTDKFCQCQPATQAALAGVAGPCILQSCSTKALDIQNTAVSECSAFLATYTSAPASVSASATATVTSSVAAATTTTSSTSTSTASSNGTVSTSGPTTTKPNTVPTSGAQQLLAGGALALFLGAVALL